MPEFAGRCRRDEPVLVVAGHQQITQEWWEMRENWKLYASRLVVAEAMRGDPGASSSRLEQLHGIPHLAMTTEVETLVVALIEATALPEKAVEDAFHIALATVHGMDFLLTWNCKHIANAIKRGIIEHVCEKAGYERLDMRCRSYAHRKNCWKKKCGLIRLLKSFTRGAGSMPPSLASTRTRFLLSCGNWMKHLPWPKTQLL